MGGAKAHRRKNKLHKHHGKGVKVSERKRRAYKDPILNILERIKHQFPINDESIEKQEGQNQTT